MSKSGIFVAMGEYLWTEQRNWRKIKKKNLFSLNSKLPRFIVSHFGFIPLFNWENVFWIFFSSSFRVRRSISFWFWCGLFCAESVNVEIYLMSRVCRNNSNDFLYFFLIYFLFPLFLSLSFTFKARMSFELSFCMSAECSFFFVLHFF